MDGSGKLWLLSPHWCVIPIGKFALKVVPVCTPIADRPKFCSDSGYVCLRWRVESISQFSGQCHVENPHLIFRFRSINHAPCLTCEGSSIISLGAIPSFRCEYFHTYVILLTLSLGTYLGMSAHRSAVARVSCPLHWDSTAAQQMCARLRSQHLEEQ